MVMQRTDETNPGVCPPLPLAGPRLGRSLKRLGADRRRQHHVMSEGPRQGISGAACRPMIKRRRASRQAAPTGCRTTPSQLSGGADSLSDGADVPHGTDLNTSRTRPRELRRNPHCLVHVFGFDQVETSQELFGLGIRPVDNG